MKKQCPLKKLRDETPPEGGEDEPGSEGGGDEGKKAKAGNERLGRLREYGKKHYNSGDSDDICESGLLTDLTNLASSSKAKKGNLSALFPHAPSLGLLAMTGTTGLPQTTYKWLVISKLSW
ncbi:hypothetical protein FA13DRAFT_1713515 [Coprinellus micaceus]|uniref:Uncharacterized protein n=1 Tax=Coprinellus micaceus TaxID=71717 RepID=A0A4Y7SWT5_COPMI|nr:hypothetical protein FA13DRAFT_1713515 [Coprinellus micaceus]